MKIKTVDKLPTCGTCPFIVAEPLPGGGTNHWCHGGPPSGMPVGDKIASYRPPVHPGFAACALHPKWPKR